MLDTKQLRKHALECMRLQTDCMELAGVAHGHDVRARFVRMAAFWDALALSGPGSGIGPKFSEAEPTK
jgi:hypothetical protein